MRHQLNAGGLLWGRIDVKLYFHHVGQRGSDEDFPKTVFGRVALSQIEGAIGPDDPLRAEIVGALRERFPEGWCNVWGVPVGARTSIANLNTGDAVLLVESVAGHGSVPAVCPDVLYWNRANPKLSQELWGNSKRMSEKRSSGESRQHEASHREGDPGFFRLG